MKQVARTTQHSVKHIEKAMVKGYMKLLTQQAANAAQKVEDYFFADDGSENELKTWYYAATAFCAAIGLFVFVAIN